jgi:hypothetical protein
MPYYESHDKHEIQKIGPDKGKPFSDSGFRSDVSTKGFDDFNGQVKDAIQYLKRHKSKIVQLREAFKVKDITLDFPIDLRIGEKIVAQFDYLPPQLISLSGELGIGIEISIYRCLSPQHTLPPS